VLAQEPDNAALLQRPNRTTIRRVLGLFKPYWRETAGMLVTILLGATLGIFPSFLQKSIIDDGLAKKNFQLVLVDSGLMILTVLIAAAVTLLYGYQSVVIGQKIMRAMRKDLFTHLEGMSLRFFTNARTGDIQTRLISDIGGIQTVVCGTFVDAISNVVIVVSALSAMIWMDWRLTLLTVSLIPVMGWAGKNLGEFGRKVRKGVQEQTSEMNSLMQENLSVSGALLGKTIGRQDVLDRKFDRENDGLAVWQIRQSILQYAFFGMMRIITQVTPAFIFILGAWLIARGHTPITLGLIIAFIGLQTRLFFPLTGIMATQVEILSSFALFDRIFEYLDMPHDIVDGPNAVALPREQVKGAVSFEDVGFKYDQDADEWTLQNISFQVEPGQLVALVGPSGAGKTTATYMVPRLYDVDAGAVKIDGRDVRDIKTDDLKLITGMVTQETYLIHTTIAENLRIAKPEATDEELIEACKSAAIHAHIASLPEGYATVVGERGYKLSGGEKQRLAIARAILKNPPILILDEATSSLDTTSERIIQGSLNTLMKGRTTFAIAHRLSTILSADLILVFQDGRIVERGRHSDLLAIDGLYAKLYNEQFEANPEDVAPEPV
jgi:ATP-binding cassette subfamily B protein